MKKLLTWFLTAAVLLSSVGTVAFAAEVTIVNRPAITQEIPVMTTQAEMVAFEKTYEAPHFEWEKEAKGIYIGGVKLEATGYYNYTSSDKQSTYGVVEQADENNFNIYIDMENREILLNDLNVKVNAGPMPYIANAAVAKYPHQVMAVYADGETGVPGVLVIEEGTYMTRGTSTGRFNWDSICYLPTGYNEDYNFGVIGLGIMTEDDWTVSLKGNNTFDIYSEFATPNRKFDMEGNFHKDAGVYGIYAKGNLTVTGDGTAKLVSESNWGSPYNERYTTVSGIWAEGNLVLSAEDITAEVSSAKHSGNTVIGETTATLMNKCGAIGSSSVVKIESGSVKANDKTDMGAGIKGSEGVVIEGGTIVAENTGAFAGAGIVAGALSWSGYEGGYVEIKGGDVTAKAVSDDAVVEGYRNSPYGSTAAPGTGISAGSNYDKEEGLGISISGGNVMATGSGAGISADSYSSISVSGGKVTATATATGFEEGGAVSGGYGVNVSLATGNYNTAIPEDYLAENSAIINGEIIAESEVPSDWVARIDNATYYLGENGADEAMSDAIAGIDSEYGKVVWLKANSSVNKENLKLGDGLTIYLAEGVEYTGSLTGDRLMADIEKGDAVYESGTEFTPYVYTMVVDPEKAYLKVVKANGEEGYFLEFGSNYSSNTAWNFAEDGDTLILMDDMFHENTTGTHSGAYDIYDAVIFDLNGHKIGSDDMSCTIKLQSFYRNGTVVFTDSSEAKTGLVYNTNGGAAVSNGYEKAVIEIEGGNFTTTENEVIRNSKGTVSISGGSFEGELDGNGTYVITGGSFTVAPDESYIPEGYKTTDESGKTNISLDDEREIDVDLTDDAPVLTATVYELDADGNANPATVTVALSDAEFTYEDGTTAANVILSVKSVAASDAHQVAEAIGDARIYDISFVDANGNEVIFKGKATVTLPCNIAYTETAKVYYITENGKLEDMSASYDSVSDTFVFETTHFSQYAVADLNSVYAEKVYIQYKATEDENTYEIYAVAEEGKVINRLSSAQLKFKLENAASNRTGVAYEITPADKVALNGPDEDGYLLFNFDGTVADSGACEEVLIGEVTFNGYGKFTFKTVDDAAKAQLHTATVIDNIVVDYDCGATKGYDLIITEAGNDTPVTDTENGGIIDTEIKVPTRELKINIDFNNAVEKKTEAYQQMKVEVYGGDLEKTVEIKLSDIAQNVNAELEGKADATYSIDVNTDNKYIVTLTNALTVNTTYNVKVSGVGYRDAYYTVTMNEDVQSKTLNFWNNVKDVAEEVEVNKSSSEKTVTFLAGDIVKDNVINIYDLSAVVSYFGEVNLVGTNNGYAKYDLNRDGKIDSKDVAYVLVSWNK